MVVKKQVHEGMDKTYARTPPFNYETLRNEFLPTSSSGKFSKILGNFRNLGDKEKRSFLDSLKKLENETSPIFIINSIIRINDKNKNKKLMENSLLLISFLYYNLSDEVQKKSVFTSLDELDKNNLVLDAAFSIIDEVDYSTFYFLANYLYRGNKILPEDKKRELNKITLKKLDEASSPIQITTIFNILSDYQIVDDGFIKKARDYLSSDEFVGKAAANYLITSSNKVDEIIAAAVNKSAAKQQALYSEKGYYVASLRFTNLDANEKKKVVDELKNILKDGEDEVAKENIKQFFSDLSSYIKEQHLSSILLLVEKLISRQEPHIKGPVWKMRLELMDSIRDVFNSKSKSISFSKVKNIMKKMKFDESQIKNLKNKMEEEVENYKNEISSLGIVDNV